MTEAMFRARARAGAMVSAAVVMGVLPRARSKRCADCRRRMARIYHHYKGYSVRHQLAVVALCTACHAHWPHEGNLTASRIARARQRHFGRMFSGTPQLVERRAALRVAA